MWNHPVLSGVISGMGPRVLLFLNTVETNCRQKTTQPSDAQTFGLGSSRRPTSKYHGKKLAGIFLKLLARCALANLPLRCTPTCTTCHRPAIRVSPRGRHPSPHPSVCHQRASPRSPRQRRRHTAPGTPRRPTPTKGSRVLVPSRLFSPPQLYERRNTAPGTSRVRASARLWLDAMCHGGTSHSHLHHDGIHRQSGLRAHVHVRILDSDPIGY